MTKRYIEIRDQSGFLQTRRGALRLVKEEQEIFSAPIEDLACVVLANPRLNISSAALQRLVSGGVSVVISNEKFEPSGLLVPLQANTLLAERLRLQIAMKPGLAKRLWTETVKQKVRRQGQLLQAIRGDDQGLIAMSSRVLSGDPKNVEAQAARRYWRALFNSEAFRRDRDAEDANRYLNYCYAVVRASLARALSAAGLNLTLGYKHHNRYNALALVDDLIEPLRPFVDQRVLAVLEEFGPNAEMSPDLRRALIGILTSAVCVDGMQWELGDCLGAVVASMVESLSSGQPQLAWPELVFGP